MRLPLRYVPGRQAAPTGTNCYWPFGRLPGRKKPLAGARGCASQRYSLISQITLPELAPCARTWWCANVAGCRASQGRIPPPLLIRQHIQLWIRNVPTVSSAVNRPVTGCRINGRAAGATTVEGHWSGHAVRCRRDSRPPSRPSTNRDSGDERSRTIAEMHLRGGPRRPCRVTPPDCGSTVSRCAVLRS